MSGLGPGEDGGGQVGQVDGGAVGGLPDLGAAAVAVGDHGRAAVGPDGGKQDPLPAGLGDLVVAAFEAEVPGQAAAARIEHFGLHAERRHHLAVGVEPQVGVLVAVHLHQRPQHRCLLRCDAGAQGVSVRAQDLGQGADRRAGLPRGGVARQQFGRLGLQRGGAAGFEPDDGHPVVQPGFQRGQGPGHDPLGVIQLAGTDPGQAAAHRLGRHLDTVAERLQGGDGVPPDAGLQINW